MSVRAKFSVQSITKTPHWDKSQGALTSIKLAPVCSGSDENKAFYATSPCGVVELSTINPAAAEQFELGKEYYVDFTAAD